MATKVTFDCRCPQSVAQITLQRRDKVSNKLHQLLFKSSGSKSVDLISGASYSLVCRALGTPGSSFLLELTKGGTMNSIQGTFPNDGRIAANRIVGVD